MRAAALSACKEPLSIGNAPDSDRPWDGVVLKTPACDVCRSDGHGWTGRPGQIGGHEHCGEVVAAQSASLACLRPPGCNVQHGMPVGHHAVQEVDLNAVHMRNLAIFGSRGMPAHRCPATLSLIEAGRADLSPVVARRVRLPDASAELAAFSGATQPGIAVIADFAAQARGSMSNLSSTDATRPARPAR